MTSPTGATPVTIPTPCPASTAAIRRSSAAIAVVSSASASASSASASSCPAQRATKSLRSTRDGNRSAHGSRRTMSNTRVLAVSVSRAATSARRQASVVNASGLTPTGSAQPGSAGPGGQHRRQAARRSDSSGCQHRHRYDVQDRVEQRQCADRRIAMATTFAAASHDQVDPGVLARVTSTPL